MSNFTGDYANALEAYVQMSCTAGARSDYVQGGGGNTSVKVNDALMAIKASGFRLDQIRPTDAYAVIDYATVRRFYEETNPATLSDVEAAGSMQAKAATQAVEGLPTLRPSVEVGFHSLLEKFVLHTHAVYANLAACSVEGAAVADAVLADLPVSHAFVPYINPGAQLTFEIAKARRETEAKTGQKPAIIFMQNHGLIITLEDAAECIALHEEVNRRIAAAYGVAFSDWPTIQIQAGPLPDTWCSNTPWLQQKLRTEPWDLAFFTQQSLYPDQLVFLAGNVAIVETGSCAEAVAANALPSEKCVLFRETGEVYYACKPSEAKTIEETLCAIFFIVGTIAAAGKTLCTMDESGKQFISGWESEKYRRQVASR